MRISSKNTAFAVKRLGDVQGVGKKRQHEINRTIRIIAMTLIKNTKYSRALTSTRINDVLKKLMTFLKQQDFHQRKTCIQLKQR